MLVVIDTNVLVSAFWSKNGTSAKVLALILNGRLTPCYDSRILAEYRGVLLRPKFNFSQWEVAGILAHIENDGMSVVPCPLTLPFIDEDDRKFYEVAKYCGAALITGNLKHFPKDDLVYSVADFLASLPD
jgi:putative PIN family toxin of toxin-antitoxin system